MNTQAKEYYTNSTAGGFYCPRCQQWVYPPHSCLLPQTQYYGQPIVYNYVTDEETKRLLKRLIELLEKLVKE